MKINRYESNILDSLPTNIYYSFNLASRQHVYLHIPVYKCQGGGKVTLIFDITSDGTTVKTEWIPIPTEHGIDIKYPIIRRIKYTEEFYIPPDLELD